MTSIYNDCVCQNCGGVGTQVWDEDDRRVEDTCYHCSGTGTVDDRVDHADNLMRAAGTIAYQIESEYRKACDSDPEGDGYDLRAAENMMTTFDYFRSRVWDRQYEIARELSGMSLADQEFLIAWERFEV